MKHLNILKQFKGKKAGLFIDEGNVFYSQKDLGWHVHWGKLLECLGKLLDIKMARYYMGMPFEKQAYEKNVLIKDRLTKEGFEVITKPLKKIYLDHTKEKFKHKCNFDVEITIDVIRNLKQFDLVIIGSGDSDFMALKQDVLNHRKGFIFICFEHNVCWEIRKCYHIFLEDIKDSIIYKRI